MIDVLQSKRDAIVAACARHGVLRLEAFGSTLRDDYKPGESDIDLLVSFSRMDSYKRVEAYFGLLGELRTLLESDIDLVMVGAVKNRYIALDIERTKRLIYAA
jgi:predicted nucleotidyltransferase